MDIHTFKQLVELNTRFYATVADDFSATRSTFWEGWHSLLPYLHAPQRHTENFKVVDMGCGNGRFYEFLTKSLSTLQVQYTGIDNSAALLDQAQKKYTNDHSLFIESDIISPLHSSSSSSIPTEPVSDLVVAFGFLHHIPSIQARQNFLSLLTSLIHENGIIVVTAWQFTAIPALMKRVTKPQLLALSPEQFEDGDYILDWQRGKNGYRYCHLTTQTEIEVLCSQAGLQIEAQFTADGKSHNLNHYYVLKKSSSEKRKS